MLTLDTRLDTPRAADGCLELPFERRSRSRQRARLADGTEVAVLLPRGTVLRGGDCLQAGDGRVVLVVAAPERVSEVHARDARALARAAYHLGNRHVPVEVGEDCLRYRHDHVLDAMLTGLGLPVRVTEAPFEPEAGAYGEHGHPHPHRHGDEPGDGPRIHHAHD